MAEGSGLTPQQEQLLGLALQEPYFLKNFYLSGGTALSSWYLHHRESYDLDFFSDLPFDYGKIARWFRENRQTIKYQSVKIDEDYGFLTILLRYHGDIILKVDFNHYSLKRIKKGAKWRGLEIDSLYDITLNKVQTIATLPRARDYVDLYSILQKKNWQMNKLLTDTARKFQGKIDALQLAKNFLKVSEYPDLPKMLTPLDVRDMEKFFSDLAKSLKKQIFTD